MVYLPFALTIENGMLSIFFPSLIVATLKYFLIKSDVTLMLYFVLSETFDTTE